MLKSLDRTKQTKLLLDSRDVLAIVFVGLFGLAALNFLFLLFLAFRVNYLAERKTTLAQLSDGNTAIVREEDYDYREPQVIRNTVRQWLDLTFNWDGVIPGTTELDKGRELGGGKRVTTNAYYASFLLQPGPQGFRQATLKVLADITPSRVFGGQVRSKAIVSHLSLPRQIRLGEWEVDVVATRILVTTNGTDEEIPFNRTFTLRASDIPSPPSSRASVLDQRLYALRSAGLEITKIVDFNPNN